MKIKLRKQTQKNTGVVLSTNQNTSTVHQQNVAQQIFASLQTILKQNLQQNINSNLSQCTAISNQQIQIIILILQI